MPGWLSVASYYVPSADNDISYANRPDPRVCTLGRVLCRFLMHLVVHPTPRRAVVGFQADTNELKNATPLLRGADSRERAVHMPA